jgi:hypothetical protein
MIAANSHQNRLQKHSTIAITAPHLLLLRDDRRSCCVDSRVDDRLVLILHLRIGQVLW